MGLLSTMYGFLSLIPILILFLPCIVRQLKTKQEMSAGGGFGRLKLKTPLIFSLALFTNVDRAVNMVVVHGIF